MEMKKIWILGILLVLLLGSGIVYRSVKSRELSIGSKMPNIEVRNNESTVNLKQMNGRYVLVDFWSAADGKSRLKSNQYNALGIEKNDHVERVSVNFDRSENLFKEIVSRDRLDPSSQFHVNDSQAEKLIRRFGLDDGFKSYLIGPDGRIESVNPDPAYLARKFHS